MRTDDEAQPKELVPFAGNDVGNSPTTAVPASITAEIKSGKPLSPVTYDGMLLQIDLVCDASQARTGVFTAMAMEDLARAAHNFEAERQCREIRLAAIYALGERLLEEEKAKGGAHYKKNPSSKVTGAEKAQTHEDRGISRNQAAKYQAVVKAIKKDRYFTLMKGPVSKGQKLPTLTGIMRAAGVAKPKKATKPAKADSGDQIVTFWQAARDLAAFAKTLNRKGAAEMGSKSKVHRDNLKLALDLLQDIDDEMVAARTAPKKGVV